MPDPTASLSAGSSLAGLLPYAPIAGGLLSAATGLIGGAVSGDAASQAAAEQAAAEQAALAFQKQVYGTAQTNLNPYIQTGTGAEGKYAGLVNGMQQPGFVDPTQPFNFSTYTDPNAVYDQQQGAKSINASSIANGSAGGGTDAALQTNAANLGNTAFTGAYGRYLTNSNMLYGQANQNYNRNYDWQNNQIAQTGNVANQGLNAANSLNNAGLSSGQQVGQTEGELGSSQSAGTMGAGNALASGINNVGNSINSGIGATNGILQTQNLINSWNQVHGKSGL
jgi:hypothetical protein